MPFSTDLREATWGDHEEAAGGRYLAALMAGRLPREAYGQMVAQHHFAYRALDDVARALADDPVAGGFVFPELYRQEALARDLTVVFGADWARRIEPTPATRELVARIEDTAGWPGGYIAHHYTRYLGDMSGGQFIGAELRKVYGFGPDGGVDFYRFEAVPSLPRFKAEYRRRLDALSLDEAERKRIIRETRLAYRLNTDVLNGLDHLVPAA
ncbi:biliverdin-producing heme oxygenase [Spongiactinospora sp. TRM90649]|uniref:biliverdin-producing heme oxygenase n=1 Tax=Spongiactinospora sp. TRM90649 TaxID=3031114 RepID=UPI0023FA16B8|nr:biliverdin-producing heme oxygenase [Spongiactinospora sp. TRM90649]MDF5757027.1 biliverdin-producing heme oxygenase [Spongiactinospora sp. TRM90649]